MSLEEGSQDTKMENLALRARRDATISFISRLPTETLAEIFLLFERQYREASFSVRNQAAQTRPFGWLVITHVCRHWRGVARTLPHLWSHVPMAHKDEPIEMFLELSNGIPLSIVPGSLAYDDELQLKIFSLLIPEAPRIRSLRLCLSTELLEELVSEVWETPLLESITLELGDEGTPPAPALAFIQNASLPALRILSLRTFHCTYVRDFLRPTLTTLIVRMPASALSVPEWAEALEGLPLLEYLALDGALEDEFFFEPVTRRVEMAHLTQIELYDWYDGIHCAWLLDHLVLPSCHELTLEVRKAKTTASEDYRHIFYTVASAMGHRFAPKSCNLRLSPGAISIELWQDMAPVLDYSTGYPAYKNHGGLDRPQVTLFFDLRECLGPRDALKAISALPLLNIHALRLDNFGCDLSLRSLSTLQAVEDLMYICAQPLKFLRAISTPKGGDHPAALLLLPALRHLTLRDAQWHRHGALCLKPFSDPPLGQQIDAAVDARRAMGVPLRELHLQGVCNLDESQDLEWFKDAPKRMPIFTWDAERRDRSDWKIPCTKCRKEVDGRAVSSDEGSDEDSEDASEDE